MLVWIAEVCSKFLNQYKCFDKLFDLIVENQHGAVKTRNVKFSHKKVVASFNRRKVINFYCYILTSRHDRPVRSFIDRKGRTYYQYHMLSMWENSHLVSFFPYGEGYKYEDKEWTKLPKQARYVLYPSGEEYRRNTYENIRQNWVVEDERSENRTEIAHKRTRRSTNRSRDRHKRSDYTNKIGEERTKT